jgi:hypothetical protein
MCCLITVLVMLGPRAVNVVWWLFDPVRWGSTFDTFIWPLLGIVFLPFTTLMYVIVFPDGISEVELLLIALAFVIDLVSWSGGGYGNRRRVESYYR